MAKPNYDFDLIVLGSGAGGSVAAHIMANARKRVAIIENDTLGGECPNWGCIPTKALLHAAEVYDAAKNGTAFGLRSATIGYNYPTVKAWKDLAVKRTGAENSRTYHEADGITVFLGQAHFLDSHTITVNRRHLSAQNFLLATGSSWSTPKVEGLEQHGYLTARSALDIARPPKSVFIMGAGSVGCEFGELFSIFGSKVHLADIAPRILPKEDQEVSTVLYERFSAKRGMEVLPSTKVLSISKEGLLKRVSYQRGGVNKSVKVDEVFVATGKQPNTDFGLENAGIEYGPKGILVNDRLQTSQPHVYAAGDCSGGYMFTHVATYESRLAAHNILNPKNSVSADYKAVPRVTFLSPEIASVGLSEEDCQRRDLEIKTAIAPISIIARSNTSNFTDGFVKVIADKKSNRIIGATVMSPRGGEVIHELTLAIQHNILPSQVASTLHAFPTWSEAVRVACAKL